MNTLMLCLTKTFHVSRYAVQQWSLISWWPDLGLTAKSLWLHTILEKWKKQSKPLRIKPSAFIKLRRDIPFSTRMLVSRRSDMGGTGERWRDKPSHICPKLETVHASVLLWDLVLWMTQLNILILSFSIFKIIPLLYSPILNEWMSDWINQLFWIWPECRIGPSAISGPSAASSVCLC